ncbi:MAG: response regulator [Ruminococcus sp.]|jgi:putative two-component system response regulator|nr:response regulator [Ruminococcus sp.]
MEEKLKKIMLVDDSESNLTVGKKLLMDKYHVFTIPTGMKLFVLLEKVIPDLILLDIEMPEMNGYEVIKRLKSDDKYKDIPVIFVTSKTERDDEEKGFALGAVDYINKPFSPSILQKRIEIHLNMSEQAHVLSKKATELEFFNNGIQLVLDSQMKIISDLQNSMIRTMAELVECRDDITGGHIERTQAYLKLLIDELLKQHIYSETTRGWNEDFLLQSSQLHDIGKISISDSVLKKPGRLTNEEFDIMKTHTTFGEEVIEKIASYSSEGVFLDYAKIFAGSHHEKWDGSGYPRGLKGEDIPLQGRVMAIADVYDALVSERPYKKAFSHTEAVKIIFDGKGTHFDPILVDVFLAVQKDFMKVAEAYKRSYN